MIVDSSALVAILAQEPSWRALREALFEAPTRGISAGTLLELTIVIDARRDPSLTRKLEDLLDTGGLTVHPVTAEQVAIGRAAYRDYGKGSGHPAQLNFGDCFAYALGRQRQEPLLYVGADFSHTDIRSGLSRQR